MNARTAMLAGMLPEHWKGIDGSRDDPAWQEGWFLTDTMRSNRAIEDGWGVDLSHPDTRAAVCRALAASLGHAGAEAYWVHVGAPREVWLMKGDQTGSGVVRIGEAVPVVFHLDADVHPSRPAEALAAIADMRAAQASE